jgi:hypothetical protein
VQQLRNHHSNYCTADCPYGETTHRQKKRLMKPVTDEEVHTRTDPTKDRKDNRRKPATCTENRRKNRTPQTPISRVLTNEKNIRSERKDAIPNITIGSADRLPEDKQHLQIFGHYVRLNLEEKQKYK